MYPLLNIIQEQEVIKQYVNDQLTCKIISEKFNVSAKCIARILRKNNIKIRGISSTKGKYVLKDDMFDIIDTEEKAYFLGFIYADGYNSESTSCLKILLHSKDRIILEQISVFFKSNRPIYTHKRKNKEDMNSVVMYSKHLSDMLKLKGCPQTKTLILEFPTEEQVPSHLIRHFVRGYFDGDGCFCNSILKKGQYKRCTLNITSTHNFCVGIQKILYKLDIHCHFQNHNKNIITLAISSHRQCCKFAEWMYQDATIFLKRKHDKYLQAKQDSINIKPRNRKK